MISVLQLLVWIKRGNPIITKNIAQAHTLRQEISRCIPKPSREKHKGQSGRIGVFGGCEEYSGAPYFAGITALKTGADLVSIFCTPSASTAIKSYSPELIVYPYLTTPDFASKVVSILPRLHSIVVGPGLGRDPVVLELIEMLLPEFQQQGLLLVLDADSLFLIGQKPHLIKGYSKSILTPNPAEFERLYQSVLNAPPNKDKLVDEVMTLAKSLGTTIVMKGDRDIISDGHKVLLCETEGGLRRCGGQGDLLAGAMSVFAYWMGESIQQKTNDKPMFTMYGPNMMAAYAACMLIRETSRQAVQMYGRSATTTDMVHLLGKHFQRLFEEPEPLHV